MLEFHTLFYKTNERGPLSIENSEVTKELICGHHLCLLELCTGSRVCSFWTGLSYSGTAEGIRKDCDLFSLI